jgi:hypothetical protein
MLIYGFRRYNKLKFKQLQIQTLVFTEILNKVSLLHPKKHKIQNLKYDFFQHPKISKELNLYQFSA